MEYNFHEEAKVFGNYLLKRNPDNQSVSLYVSAMEKMQLVLSEKEKRMLGFIMKNKWSVGILDSSLAMFDKRSAVRKKLFVMFAILEVSPRNSAAFLPRRNPPFYFLYVLYAGIRSVAKSLIGSLLISFI